MLNYEPKPYGPTIDYDFEREVHVNRKRVLRVMREPSLLVRSRRLRARRKREWGRVEATRPNQIWQSDMTRIWAGPSVGWAYLVSVIDCCSQEIVGWKLSHRCRTKALDAVEQAVLECLPAGSRENDLTLTTDNGTQFSSTRFMETLAASHIAARLITTRKVPAACAGCPSSED